MDTDLRIQRVPITHPDAMLLVEAVQEEYVVRYGSRDESPIDPTDFEDPRGQFFVGYLDGMPVATGAWRRSTVEAFGTSRTAEVKRMYVVPAAQRRGHARRMLAHLEATAAAAVASRWASIRRACPRRWAAGTTYIRLTSAVTPVPRASTVLRRQAPVATGSLPR